MKQLMWLIGVMILLVLSGCSATRGLVSVSSENVSAQAQWGALDSAKREYQNLISIIKKSNRSEKTETVTTKVITTYGKKDSTGSQPVAKKIEYSQKSAKVLDEQTLSTYKESLSELTEKLSKANTIITEQKTVVTSLREEVKNHADSLADLTAQFARLIKLLLIVGAVCLFVIVIYTLRKKIGVFLERFKKKI